MDLQMTRGDTYSLNVAVTNADGSVRNITGATLVFTAKHGYGDADVDAVFQISQAPTNPTAGTSAISVPATATIGLPGLAVLVYDVELREASGQVTTLQSGKLTVLADASIA